MKKSSKLLFFLVILVITLSIIINFIPVTAADTFIDEIVTVNAGTYRGYSFNANYDNVTIIVTIEVLSGNDISVHVTDETNFEKWSNGESAVGYLTKQKMGSFTEEITLGSAGRYYVILDNSYSIITGKSVHVLIETESSPDLTLLLLGFIAVVGGLGIFAAILIIRSRSAIRHVSPPPMALSESPSAVPPVTQSSYGFCPSCGKPLDHLGKFCMKCGQKIPNKDE